MRVLGGVLAAAWVLAFLGFGGVHHGTRAALHGLLAVAALLAWTLPRSALHRSGRLWPLVAAAALMLVAVLPAALPLPAAVARWVSPGRVAASPGAALVLSSANLESSVDASTHLVLVASAALLLGAWGIAAWSRTPVERALQVAALALPAIGLVHAWTGTTALFGLVPTWIRPPHVFFAPFLAPPHAAGALLLPLPFLAWSAARPEATPWQRVASGLATALLLGALVVNSATGPLAIALLVLAAVARRSGRIGWPGLLAVAPVALAVVLGWDLAQGPRQFWTLHGRASIWADSGRLFLDHWLFGSGAGTFEAAVGPYRSDLRYQTWEHAHQDYLEWATETGLWGLACLAAAVIVARPPSARNEDRAWAVAAGAWAVLLHACVDFPLRLPALAMSAAGLLAWRAAVHQDRLESNPSGLKAVFAVLALMNLGAAGWELRAREVGMAASAAWAGTEDPADERTLARWAPWRPELELVRARSELRAGRVEQALEHVTSMLGSHPDHPQALRMGALLLVGMGRPVEALTAADRAVGRSAWDWRSHAVRARVLALSEPERAPAAWLEAVRRGAPATTFEEAWATLPVGLYWVQAMGGEGTRELALAGFLAGKGDLDAATLAFEEARWGAEEDEGEPEPLPPEYLDVLVRAGRLEDADRFLAELATGREDPRWIAAEARLREAQGRWREASDLWLGLGVRTPQHRLRAVRALREAEGDQAALVLLERLRHEGASFDRALALERAAMQSRLGLREECMRDLLDLHSSTFSDAPAEALRRCGATTPAAAP